MFDLLFIVSIVGTAVQAIKESCTPIVPIENLANTELRHKDIMNGVSVEQRMKNVENGKYRLIETYPEPHRNPENGKIIIENCKLYWEDVEKYGAWQAQQWVKRGKYNLSPEELVKERNRISAEHEYQFGRKNIDKILKTT